MENLSAETLDSGIADDVDRELDKLEMELKSEQPRHRPTHVVTGVPIALTWADLTECRSELSNGELLKRLAAQAARVASGAQFDAERVEYRKLHLALNRKLLTPPRVRPLIPGKRHGHKIGFTRSDGALIVDKQVIDLDWLHCAKKRDRIPEPGFEHMFLNDQCIDWVSAEALALKNWKPETKVIQSLMLSDAEQFPLVLLQTPKLRARWSRIRKQAPAIETALKNRAERFTSMRGQEHALALIWQADELGLDAPLRIKANLHQWMSSASEPLSTERFREQKRRVRRHLEQTGA
ncbi:hypothetical protein AX768_02260 [Burkholderia sp. PAMC 28687]|uniref:hypothetical protein n=1 Tax=Burkholderia sp. PAMC 28687 TaxID=1795874 RepID=UPI000781E7FC|nr:hypothetical protein [Burkholderia sp. PAMC 28687]AMM13112.1 hypothetical protein AX768_02260 [Burkholderia sp. PAMC 28687]